MPTSNVTENAKMIGESLKMCIEQAYDQDRLTFGIFESVQQLENDPERAMLLLLLGNPHCDDITFHLQAKLIEAYCWEHHIHVIKISDTSALYKHVQRKQRACKGTRSVKHVKATDFNCVLVECPSEPDDFSEEDKHVIQYCHVTEHLLPQPIISLPSD